MPVIVARNCLATHFQELVSKCGKRLTVTPELKNACDMAAYWLVEGQSYGLKIIGGNGTGKSTLLEAIRLTVADCMKYYPERKRVLMAKYLATEIADMFRRGDDICEMLYKFRVLAIDDVGSEPLKTVYFGNEIWPVADLIHRRADHFKITVLTMNTSGTDVRDKYGPRVYDRMRDMTTIILDGNSNRGNHDGI